MAPPPPPTLEPRAASLPAGGAWSRWPWVLLAVALLLAAFAR